MKKLQVLGLLVVLMLGCVMTGCSSSSEESMYDKMKEIEERADELDVESDNEQFED